MTVSSVSGPVGWAAVAAAVAVLLAGAGRSGPDRALPLRRSGRLAAREPGRVAVTSWARRLRGGRVRGRVVVLALGALVLLVAGPALGVAAAVATGTAVRLGGDAAEGRRARARRSDVTAAVRVLVAELESGSAAPSALSAAADSGPLVAGPFRRAAEAAASGTDAGGVLAAGGDPDLAAVGAAWRLATATGAAPAAVLARVLADLGAVEAQHRAVTVALAGPRSSAVVLAGLPVVGVALGAAMGARPLAFLLADPAGRVLCCAGVLLDAAGLLWLRGIVRRAAAG